MKITQTSVSVLCFILLLGFASQTAAQETMLKWFGHAAFSITTPKGKVLLIDPWLKNPSNPEAKDGKDPLAAVPKVDYILLTHGHRDHAGDAVAIATRRCIVGVRLERSPCSEKASSFPCHRYIAA